ncbi:MAG: FKBP-type peptidyl-prolyl cis-trans isomerase [Candidatus Sumerlaeia bacterium]|nr:FKBP-type peptidyl-prolyl cis-trans isomerase [Candidatus Sumerlaeia bacterium]
MAEEEATQAAPVLDTEEKKISYVIGSQIANDLAQIGEIGVTLDIDLLLRGLRDGMEDRSAVTPDQVQEAMSALQMKAMEAQMQQQAQAETQAADAPDAQANLQIANEFLAGNAEREDVTVTDSGLQYRVISSGDGDTPGSDDQVKAHYTGRLIDGTVFDSSVERGEPFTFSTAGGVIPGWIEAAKMMKEGDKWEVYIPPNLAYGAQGRMPTIPPNSVLVFELELLEVVN